MLLLFTDNERADPFTTADTPRVCEDTHDLANQARSRAPLFYEK